MSLSRTADRGIHTRLYFSTGANKMIMFYRTFPRKEEDRERAPLNVKPHTYPFYYEKYD